MSKGLPQLLTLSLLGAAIVVLIGIGLESVINSLDDMLEPCQHGTSYNKLTSSCDCRNTPFRGKYCGICDCQHGQCMVGGTTPKAGSLYGCRCPINTKRFGHKCQLCFTNNTESCDGPCANGFYGALCDKTCLPTLTQTELFIGDSTDASTCKNIRDNGGTCNYCSAHGSCGATGDCECEKNYFNGPNGGCSQTCPVSSNGMICSGHGVCEKIAGVPTCACEYGWRGTDCNIPCPGVRETGDPCSGHGQCLVDYSGTPTTSCNCNQKFRGEACEKECPGEFVACTGHGQCDDNAQCTCDSPAGGITWVGEACECSDFVTCNGNGNCNANAECVCIGNWDGKHCRQCKENYYGSNCQHKCNADGEPSTDILGCYGRGTCTILDFGMSSERVVCECFSAKKTFDDGKVLTVFANYETLDNCRDCVAGYVPKVTAVDQYGLPDGVAVPCELFCDSLTCNKLGECNEDFGIPNEPMCHCDHGPDNKKHLDDNNFCLTCETGWFPEDLHSLDGCSNFCTTDIGNSPYHGNFPSICATGVVDCKHCSGHGTCSGSGECLCEEGYTGVECNIQCTGADGKTCSGHGECKVNKLQELMQFEYEFVNSSGALYSCECEPQDPYTDEERNDFKIRVANGEINGTLEDPPIKTFYGEMCEYNCKTPPWANAEVCNGFGDCEINQIQAPNGGIVTCVNDDDCKYNTQLMALLSGVVDWSTEKGPFCHKVEEPPGCTTTNLINEDCFYILSIQRPTAARGKECMRDADCRVYMDDHDWYGWCNSIEAAQNPFTTCSSDHETYCQLINSNNVIDSSCKDLVNQLSNSTFSITDQLNYCYEKDKAKYPFKMTEAYRYKEDIDKHDEVAESFQNFAIKHPTVTMDASQYCAQYLNIFAVPVTHIRTDTLFICNNKIQHTDNCSTTALALDTVWKPFYVDCDGVQTQYTTLEEAIDNRHEGCMIVEEVVEVENATLQTLFNVKAQLGQHCVDNVDCNSTLCYEGTCCTAGTDTMNCAKCNSQGTCDCLPGAQIVSGTCQTPSFKTYYGGPSDASVTEDDCEQYATEINKVFEELEIQWRAFHPVGCHLENGKVYWNPKATSGEDCGVTRATFLGCVTSWSCPGTDGNWIDNIGCVNASVGDSCTSNVNCKSDACVGGTCAVEYQANCAQVNASGSCIQCIADATLQGSSCLQGQCPSDKMFVTDEGCVDKPSDALEQQVQNLLEKTCSNAESIFPQCKLPTNACDVNGISACKDGDTCEPFESDAICSTVGVLNATCKFGLQAVPLSFSTYQCVGNFAVDNTCLEAAREMNWFSYCKGSNAVLLHDNFGVDALQENKQPTVITLEEDQRGGDLLSFWVKTDSILQSSASLAAKSGSDEIFRVYLHQGQIQLNGISTLQSCPVDQPTCNDDFSHSINQWLNIKVSITYGASRSVTLHYNGKTKTGGFLCTGCSSVSGVQTIHIEAGTADTYYDEIIFSKAIAEPTAKTSCSTYQYCDHDVDYRAKCIDLLTNVKYPRTVEPQLDIVDICKSRKTNKKFVGVTTTTAIKEEMDLLNWTTYCKFTEELEEDISCGTLTYSTLEDYPTKCDPWIAPVDTSKTCVLENLQHNWTQQCQNISEAFIPANMKTQCSEACYQHLVGYDQCPVRKTIFSSNVDIPFSISGCNSINWLDYCNDVAQNKHTGVCSAVECDCSSQQGMTGESCELFCNLASDGSPCGVDSGVGVCQYTDEQQAQLAVGPYQTEMIEILGECDCFASEGTSNCDQECVACVNTTYDPRRAVNLEFGNNGDNHYTYNGEDDPEIQLCSNTSVTFTRTTAGHPLRVVKKSDCPQCSIGDHAAVLPSAPPVEQLHFGNNGASDYVYNNQNDPTIYLCANKLYRFNRTTSGHPLRVVNGSDCTGCSSGTHNFSSSSLNGWLDVQGLGTSDFTFIKTGIYYYICTAHASMVGRINVGTCTDRRRRLLNANNPTVPTSSLPGWTDVTDSAAFTYTFTEPGTYYYICVAHSLMVGKITVASCGSQTGVCDASRGICQCLPPWVSEVQVEFESWKGNTRSKIERRYNLPTSLTSVQSTNDAYDKAQEDIMRIRMMQGREAFTRYYLDTTRTEDNWKTAYEEFKLSPSTYQCAGKPCDFHDVVLLGNLQTTSFSYNYDCGKTCPAVDANKIPCSGNGRCAITGSCVCDTAKVIRGTDAATGSTFNINIFGGETLEKSDFMISKLDQTGYRGEDCSLTCPGYHPERQDMTEVCSGHGVCNINAECQCDIGYTGEVCQFSCPGYVEGDLNVCAGHGTCGMSEVKIFSDIFDEFDETFYYSNGTSAVRKTNEQRDCTLPASKAVGLGYSIINDIAFLDLSKIYLIREYELCTSPSVEQCKKWKDYQNIYYVNRHPFTVNDYSKASGCILDGNTVMFNDRTTEVTCENGCVCEGVTQEVAGVISIHDYMGKVGTPYGYEPLTEWDGYIFKDSGLATADSQIKMHEYECYFYADKALLQPYIEVQTGAPSMEVTRDECRRYTSDSHELSMFEDVDDSAIPKGCVKKMPSGVLEKVMYNTNENTVACSSTNRCLEKPYERINDAAKPPGCLKIGNDIKFNDAVSSVVCGSSNICIEKEIKIMEPRVIYHTAVGFNYSENEGRYQTGDLIWTGNFVNGNKEYISNVIAGPDTEANIINTCDNDPDCGGYFAIIPDTEGTYMAVSKFNNAIMAGRTEAYRLLGYQTECIGDLNVVIHEKAIGKPDLNKDSVTSEQCRKYAQSYQRVFTSGSYPSYPVGCYLNTADDGVYFNIQTTTVECSSTKICYESVTRRKRDIGATFYLDDWSMPDDSVTQAECQEYATSISGTFATSNEVGNPQGCYAQGSSVKYNTNTVSVAACGISSQSLCVKKRSTFFTPVTPANNDIDLNSCAEVCRVTYQCESFSVENNVCHMHDGCDQTQAGTNEVYLMLTADNGKMYKYMMKLPPMLCMTENGRNFDEKTQAPVLRTVNMLRTKCTGGLIWSNRLEACVDYSEKPRFDATFFLDKDTENEEQLPVQCEITGSETARCALCTCLSDYIYGKWAGFTCDTCDVGYGNSQCRQICPGFDGDNVNSMCNGKGACLFGSEENSEGERLFQQANCVCGQENQYADRHPTDELVANYPDTGGIAGDGSVVAYYYFTPIPYTQTFLSLYDAQTKCTRFNNLDNLDRGGFCFGVYRKYISISESSQEVYLVMGFVGGSYTLYGKWWKKNAVSGYSKFYNFKNRELYSAADGLPTPKECTDLLSIRSEGYDTCNHFSSEDIDPSCTRCEDGWTGKNCRYVCSKCLLGGGCAGVPSESTSSNCNCPAGAGALWEHQCCPTGFMVADKASWAGKSQTDVDSIRISLVYDSSTTNELDASYYCKTCPGVTHIDWMSPDALYKVCSGPSRGTCMSVAGSLQLACDCKMNSVTKNRWFGRACACDETINIPYSTDANVAESTDYGCLIPTNGQGVCPTSSTDKLFFNPPRIYIQDAYYISGESYGSPFFGIFAGQTYVIKKAICSRSSPCHTGEGECESDDQCAGTLKCFIRTNGEERKSFSAEKIPYDMNYCYHEAETMVGCHPADFEEYLNTREYHKQFYYNAADASFQPPILGRYVPYTQDANLAMVIHQQSFPCPVGRYGITVPDKITYGNKWNGYVNGGSNVNVYDGVNGDNPGSAETQLQRCFEACLNQKAPLTGTWTFQARAFAMESTGKCFCYSVSIAGGTTVANSAWAAYDILTEGEWHVCERCQPGKYQDNELQIQIIKVYSGVNTGLSVTEEECSTYAYWHRNTESGAHVAYTSSYSNPTYPHGCFITSTGVFYQQGASSAGCGSSQICLQYGGGFGLAPTDKQPNCKNCPSGKFGGPIGSWSADFCTECQAGQQDDADGLGCTDCAAGKYEIGGNCIFCPNGQYSPQKYVGNANPCFICPIGKDTNGQIGTAGSTDADCTPCPAGRANGVPGGNCLNCAPGSYTATSGQSTCTDCETQKWANLAGLTECKTCGVDAPYDGLYGAVANRDTCVACNTGEKVNTATGFCEDCPTGTDQPLTTYQTSCPNCEVGRYGDVAGLADCKNCGSGEYQNEVAKTSCKTCGTGKYGDSSEGTGCTDCAKGKYQNQNSQTSCKDCSNGYYADVTGLANCKSCPAGKRGNGGSVVDSLSGGCANCNIGEYQNEDGQTSCKNCPAGKGTTGFGNDASSDCSNCPSTYSGPTTQSSPANQGEPSCSSCGGKSWTTHRLPSSTDIRGSNCGSSKHWSNSKYCGSCGWWECKFNCNGDPCGCYSWSTYPDHPSCSGFECLHTCGWQGQWNTCGWRL